VFSFPDELADLADLAGDWKGLSGAPNSSFSTANEARLADSIQLKTETFASGAM
jgi:hypothetical protein